MVKKQFKTTQKQLWVKFNETDQQLKHDLKVYFETSARLSQSDDVKYLIQLGLKVINGQYHDEELSQIIHQIQNLNLSLQDEVATNNAILQGIGDLQDAYTGQESDIDALITPTTQRTQRRHQKIKKR